MVQIGIGRWVTDRPSHRRLQFCHRGWVMQPALIIRYHSGRAYDPDTRLAFLNQNMTASILLAKGNLTIAANKLDN